jgi:ubiquinone/menaquinone biosynthesis C-methylase UbiE
MNSAPGKEILALIREGNYAHPGEEEAIDLTFGSLPGSPHRQVLDIGCGRGGTADYVQRHGWGTVTGVDIDAETLAAARELYLEVTFTVADAGHISELGRSRFDLLYLFNAFYAFPDQSQALREMYSVARPGARLMIFDYTGQDGSPHDTGNWQESDKGEKYTPFSHQSWTPLHPDHFPGELQRACWELEDNIDFSTHYLRWYQNLCDRIRANRERIIAGYGEEWYEYTAATYENLREAVANGSIGGAVYWARRI